MKVSVGVFSGNWCELREGSVTALQQGLRTWAAVCAPTSPRWARAAGWAPRPPGGGTATPAPTSWTNQRRPSGHVTGGWTNQGRGTATPQDRPWTRRRRSRSWPRGWTREGSLAPGAGWISAVLSCSVLYKWHATSIQLFITTFSYLDDTNAYSMVQVWAWLWQLAIITIN